MSINNKGTGDMIDAQLSAVAAMYTEESYWTRLRRMSAGLRAPRQSREYKAAIIELQRLSAPLSAIALPALLVGLLVLLGTGNSGNDRIIETEIMDMEAVQDLQEPEEYEPPPERPDDLTVDIQVDGPSVDVVNPTQNNAYSPQPQTFDAVQVVKSPVILKGIFGDRSNTGTRGTSLRRFGGDQKTEDAVMRALRWLKMKQDADGSWGGNRIAMTGLAILTFLAHGETPDSDKSPEFAQTVQKAIDYLISKQKEDGRFTGKDGNDYSHPIATYALSEAYGMTMNPNVKAVAEKALVPIIKGQHPTGGWTYNMDPNAGEDGKYRDDTSYMGWCAQALKAAKLAKIPATGLENATKQAVRGFKANAGPSGGFSYTGPGADGMTAVGTLCMQLLGAADAREVKLSLEMMKAWKPNFGEKEPNVSGHCTACPQYYYYYATQCKFHADGGKGSNWDKWNNEMKTVYVTEQKIQKAAVKDHEGKDQDVGWWENKDNHTDRPVMDTCLAALQLMVYYRYLPTTQADAVKVEEEIAATATDTEDIKISVDI